MVSYHTRHIQVFASNDLIPIDIRTSNLMMKVFALTTDFQMCLGDIPRRLVPPPTPFNAAGQRSLLTPKRLLTCAIMARVLYRVAVAVGKKHFQSYVNANILNGKRKWNRNDFADNQDVPVTVSAKNKM